MASFIGHMFGGRAHIMDVFTPSIEAGYGAAYGNVYGGSVWQAGYIQHSNTVIINHGTYNTISDLLDIYTYTHATAPISTTNIPIPIVHWGANACSCMDIPTTWAQNCPVLLGKAGSVFHMWLGVGAKPS